MRFAALLLAQEAPDLDAIVTLRLPRAVNAAAEHTRRSGAAAAPADCEYRDSLSHSGADSDPHPSESDYRESDIEKDHPFERFTTAPRRAGK